MSERSTLPIAEIIEENETVRTLYFDYELAGQPGQFIMLTDLENGEKPFSISECDDDYFAVTIKKLGKFTESIFQKQAGDLLSFRGPYGSSFSLGGENCLLVGGGYAVPPLYFLSRELLKRRSNITVINGARTQEDLVFCGRFQKMGLDYKRITDAGCLGRAGTSLDIARELLSQQKFDMVYVSGPELMMSAMRLVLAEFKELEYEFLFERYMKCAIGICGNCTIDPLGIRLCVEGPVLARTQIEQLTEFGKYHRNAAGTKQYY